HGRTPARKPQCGSHQHLSRAGAQGRRAGAAARCAERIPARAVASPVERNGTLFGCLDPFAGSPRISRRPWAPLSGFCGVPRWQRHRHLTGRRARHTPRFSTDLHHRLLHHFHRHALCVALFARGGDRIPRGRPLPLPRTQPGDEVLRPIAGRRGLLYPPPEHRPVAARKGKSHGPVGPVHIQVMKRCIHIPRLLPVLAAVAMAFCVQAQGGDQALLAEAGLLFEKGEYAKAYPMYSQLVSLSPRDHELNYKYGACILYGDDDKSKAIGYLKFATSGPATSNLAWYFLGRAYQLDYQFTEAISAYQHYRGTADKKLMARFPVDILVQQCRNGKFLLSNLKDIE